MTAALEAQVAELRERLARVEATVDLRERLARVEATVDLRGRTSRTPDEFQLPLFARVRQERIVQAVAGTWHVDQDDVVGRIREGFAMQPRFAAMWLARQLIKASLPQLGRLFDRDHTTIIHALKRAEGWRIADDDFRKATDRLLGELRAEFIGGHHA